MTLKEKFDNPIMRHDLGRNEIEETKQQCVEIADEFAIGFADWMRKNGVYISIDDIGDYAFDIGVNNYTSKELLEICKKEKGL